jgi:hypothetical protein
MNLVEFAWLCGSLTASILILLAMFPNIQRLLILRAFGADPAEVRVANILHRAAGAFADYRIFSFHVGSAPRLGVALVRSVHRAFLRNTDYSRNESLESWAAHVVYHRRKYRRRSVVELTALIEALASTGRMNGPEGVNEFLDIIEDDVLGGAAYLRVVGDVYAASAGIRAGVAPEYAAAI